MSYKLRIIRKANYLHAVVTGDNNRENVKKYLDEILNECISRNCFKVLIEERLEGPRLETFDVFFIASDGASKALGKLKAIAYVDINAEGKLMKFAENVAVNRLLPVRLFATVEEAEKWLLGEEDNG